MKYVIWQLLSFAVVFAVPVGLQAFLSCRRSKWPGRVLPILSAGLSVIIAVTGSVHSAFTMTADRTVMTACWLLVLWNIPTAVYLLIYFLCRRQGRRKRELEKMNVQDLE